MNFNDRELKALIYATEAHKGQMRKDGVTPYIIHPIGVANEVRKHYLQEAMFIAALFHDILEDTDVTEAQMCSDWGDKITDLVVGLTNTSKITNPELNRAARHEMDLERLLKQNLQVIQIKLQDIRYNINDLKGMGGFAHKFLSEKQEFIIAIHDMYETCDDITLWCNKIMDDIIEQKRKIFQGKL